MRVRRRVNASDRDAKKKKKGKKGTRRRRFLLLTAWRKSRRVGSIHEELPRRDYLRVCGSTRQTIEDFEGDVGS